jgi:hypothetical protein
MTSVVNILPEAKITITGFSDNCSVNKMKEKNHTVGIIPKSNRIIVEREAKSIPI